MQSTQKFSSWRKIWYLGIGSLLLVGLTAVLSSAGPVHAGSGVRTSLSDQRLRILGTSGDDTITVVGSDGQVCMSVPAASPVCHAGVSTVQIYGYGGADQINVTGEFAANVLVNGGSHDDALAVTVADVGGDVIVRGGGGNDFLALTNVFFDNLNLNGASGTDIVEAEELYGNRAVFSLGAGSSEQRAFIQDSEFQSFRFTGGSSSDNVTILNVLFGQNPVINTAGGSDTLMLHNSRSVGATAPQRTFRVLLGAGDDRFDFSSDHTTASDSLIVKAGNGDDVMTISTTTAVTTVKRIDGGANNDTLHVSGTAVNGAVVNVENVVTSSN